jgi:hypothetical protein
MRTAIGKVISPKGQINSPLVFRQRAKLGKPESAEFFGKVRCCFIGLSQKSPQENKAKM